MLSTIRNKATGLISYILIGAICLSFALWGVSSYFEGASQVNVASVNGDDIAYEYYQNRLRGRQQQLRQQFQDALPENYFESESFKLQIVNGIIDEILANQLIEDRHYTLNDAELASIIKSTSSFMTDGKFDNERYHRALSTSNYTVQTYEVSQRAQGAFYKVKNAVSQSYHIDDEELNDLLKLQKQRRFADYFVIENTAFEPVISEQDINDYYEQEKDQYKTQEQMKIDYIELSVDAIESTESISDDEVLEYYETNKSDFSEPEVRKASHILIKPEKDDADSQAAVLESAEKLIEKINSGEDFAELARQFSTDKGSAAKGGELGVITKGVMVKPFEDAVFALELNQLSEPIKTQFGYHIIKLTELIEEKISPLEEVKEEVSARLLKDQAIEKFTDEAETFKNLAFESIDTLQPIADELGLEIKQTSWFTRGDGSDVAQLPQVRNAAFSDDVVKNDINADIVAIGSDRLIALRKNEYKPAVIKPIEEVKESINSTLTLIRSKEMALKKGQMILENLLADADQWQKTIDDGSYKLLVMAQIRDEAQQGVESQISESVFEQPKPDDQKPVYNGLETVNGYAIYRFTKLEPATQEDIIKVSDEEREALTSRLTQRFGTGNLYSLLELSRQNADISIFNENL